MNWLDMIIVFILFSIAWTAGYIVGYSARPHEELKERVKKGIRYIKTNTKKSRVISPSKEFNNAKFLDDITKQND